MSEILSEKTGFDRSTHNEETLIKNVAKKILDKPALLTVNSWHSKESHCVVGWAIHLVAQAKAIETTYSAEVAGCVLLPNHTHLFYQNRATLHAIYT